MIWSDTPCRTTCWGFGNKVAEGLQHPSIECVVVSIPGWRTTPCSPTSSFRSTPSSRSRTSASTATAQYFSVFLEDKSLEPVGESKSDYEAVCEVAKAMGLFGEFTKGKTVESGIKTAYELSGVKDLVSWEELREKSYYVVPIAPDWEKDKPGMHAFVSDPKANPLQTPSGLLEIYSEALATTFPCDLERPAHPQVGGAGRDARRAAVLLARQEVSAADVLEPSAVAAACAVRRYPWTREAPTGKVRGVDGYMYEPVWLNPLEAEKRGIKSGDIVKVYNERGIVLGGAYVTERIRYPGRLHGSRRAL